jgi:hypothetical protein
MSAPQTTTRKLLFILPRIRVILDVPSLMVISFCMSQDLEKSGGTPDDRYSHPEVTENSGKKPFFSVFSVPLRGW